jgi:hypothetical protein
MTLNTTHALFSSNCHDPVLRSNRCSQGLRGMLDSGGVMAGRNQ